MRADVFSSENAADPSDGASKVRRGGSFALFTLGCYGRLPDRAHNAIGESKPSFQLDSRCS